MIKKLWAVLAIALMGTIVVQLREAEKAEAAALCFTVMDRRTFPDRARFSCSSDSRGGAGWVQGTVMCATSSAGNYYIKRSPIYYKPRGAPLSFTIYCTNLRPYLYNAWVESWGN